MAVPYFFVALGYFFALHLPDNCKGNGAKVDIARNRYCHRILYPLIVFSIINTVQQCVSVGMQNGWTVYAVVGIIKHVFFMPYGGIWYLWASIVGVILLSEVLKRDQLILDS